MSESFLIGTLAHYRLFSGRKLKTPGACGGRHYDEPPNPGSAGPMADKRSCGFINLLYKHFL